MKQTFILVIGLILLISCKEVSFKDPQPKGKKALNKVPEKLVGMYSLANDEGKVEDTLYINSNGYKVGHNPKDVAFLSDSLVLKYYKGYYFININKNPEWLLRVLQRNKNGDLIFLGMEDENSNFNDFLKRLSSEVEIDSTQNGDESLYQINPSPKQLVGLIKKGFFKKTVLKKIN